MTDFGAVRAVAAQDILDGLRGRLQLLVRAAVPIVLFVLVLGVAVFTRAPTIVRVDDPVELAVEGDMPGAQALLTAVGRYDVVVEPTDDAALAASRTSDASVVLPSGVDDAIARGEPVEIIVYQSARDRRSTTAVALFQAGVTDTLAPEQPATTTAFPVEIVDVQLTERGSELGIAGAVPALLCLQAGLLTGGVALRLAARRTGGRLVSQLLLPIRRADVALAKGVAELVVGLIAALPIVIPVVVLTVIVQAARHGIASATWVLVATVATSIALSAVMAGLGVLIGTASRSQEQITLGSAVAVIMMAAVAGVVALGTFALPSVAAVVPVVGLVSQLRALLEGSGNPILFVVGLATTVGTAVLFARSGGRMLSAERLVLRES